MKRFTLLSNGQDLDTGIYEYFPYADKAILNPKKVNKILGDLKKGSFPRGTNKYIYGQYCVSREEDYENVIEYAYNAFQLFKKFSLKRKRKIFYDLYNRLIEKKEEFINLLIVEGHPRKLAEWEFEGMKIGSSPKTIDFYFSQLRREIKQADNESLYWVRRPDGVVCLSPPRNASASSSYNAILVFLTGNTLVVKPPQKIPLSTIYLWKEIVWEVLEKNNVPQGVLNIVLGNSKKIGDTWFKSPLVSDIIYFGKSIRGIDVGNKIYQSGKKPILELSGNDLLLVWKEVDLKAVADSLIDCFLGSTQICMVPKVALIHQEIYEKFINIFMRKVKSLKFGLPSDNETIFSPVVKIKEFFRFLEDVLAKGGKCIYGGKRVNHMGEEDETGLYLQPTLIEIDEIASVKSMRCIQEEIFFPLLPLIRVKGDDEIIFEKMASMVKHHQYGLRVSLWIKSAKYLRKFVKDLDNTGLLRINTKHTGFSYYLSTHGGTGRSGGPFGEMSYFWHKTSHLQGIVRCRKS